MTEFEIMLDEAYNLLENNKTNNLDIKIPEPILIKNGNKILWKNVKEYLKIVKKPPDHFLLFLNNELSNCVSWISDSKSDGLIFQTKIISSSIIKLMKKYLIEYVICKSCHSNDTELIKDKNIRKYKFKCNFCFQEIYL
jgi:translation initiation factor 2 subunit 2